MFEISKRFPVKVAKNKFCSQFHFRHYINSVVYHAVQYRVSVDAHTSAGLSFQGLDSLRRATEKLPQTAAKQKFLLVGSFKNSAGAINKKQLSPAEH